MFNMILLDESYGGQTRENNAILRLLQPYGHGRAAAHIPGSVR